MAYPDSSYWNNSGKHQEHIDSLDDLIPATGSVSHPRSKNRALEKYRKASNCYYDLFNNGLCNRADEFRRVFNISSSHYKLYGSYGRYNNRLYELVEEKMDKITEAAVNEQELTCAA